MAERSMIKLSVNFTDKTIEMKNYETDDEETCFSNDIGIQKYLFVPWASSADDYKNRNRKLAVGFRNTAGPDYRFWLWEKDGAIYYNTNDSWGANAEKVPGDSDGGWWKALIISYNASTSKYELKLKTIPGN